ncbi:exportin-T [Prunus yedoensis var. nudiflora]|uniref:Exportin-T n=1 Tax=Prunus yedoensis var. nudiflora TaxID=2094558 RepID=A0A314Y9S5_PRUYE|nr:exportin-T [Prunus yedoensis var. nudiflora]
MDYTSKELLGSEDGSHIFEVEALLRNAKVLINSLIKVTSFVHRMVDTLGASVFPYLPKALEQLLVDSEV